MARNFLIALMMSMLSSASAQDPVEGPASCIVTHKKNDTETPTTTCFENISLERTAFEYGVCQWKTDAQAAANVRVTTQFVPRCPASYSANCDRLVLGSGMVAPVKIFLYDQSIDVLARAKNQCLSGGGNWQTNDAQPNQP